MTTNGTSWMQLARDIRTGNLPQGWAVGRRSPKGVVRWYAIRVPEGREAATAVKLRALVPADLMPDIFQITKERWFKRSGEWSLQAKPLFPGWLIAATDDPRALDRVLAQLTLGVRLASGDGRSFIPMDKSAQAFYEGAMDAGHCLRNSVGLIGPAGLRVVQGPLAGREAQVSRYDRHRRFCLVEGGEGPDPFSESMPLDIPEAIYHMQRSTAHKQDDDIRREEPRVIGDVKKTLSEATPTVEVMKSNQRDELRSTDVGSIPTPGTPEFYVYCRSLDGGSPAYRAVKRAFDVAFSACVLAVIAVPSLALAAAIRIESPGNPFYSQTRVGRIGPDGNPITFRMWKFRSMYADADERLAELKSRNEVSGPMFKMRDDPRVTRIGRFIRKHSIDEFPQFLNVLLGDMSVVGPRPPLPREVEEYSASDLRRLAVRPGLTGPWQAGERSDTDFGRMVELDLGYIRGRSALGDLKLIARTVGVVFSGDGAY